MRSAIAMAVLAGCGAASTPAATPSSLDGRRAALKAVIDDQWEDSLKRSPEFASLLGDRRYNDRWTDLSDAAAHAEIAADRAFLARVQAIDTAGFSDQEQLDAQLLARKLTIAVDGERFEDWLMPISIKNGPQLFLPQLASSVPFETVKDYDDYIARLRAVPAVMAAVTDDARAGLAKHLMPPQVLLDGLADQIDAIAASAPDASPFATPLAKLPASFSEADRAHIRDAMVAAIRDQVAPAYKQLAAFVRADYASHGRADVGLWALPLGVERYQRAVFENTTTTMTADEIHELGLREVARIEGEMNATANKLGYADMHALVAAVDKDPARHFHSRDEVVQRYQHYIDGMYGKLPSLFGHLPQGKLRVEAVEPFREAVAAAASYEQGSPDGKRPGRVMVNAGSFESRSTLNVETTAYHEGVPGHHLQLAIASEQTDLPMFRRYEFFVAYGEGWALYAERLGEEVGMYTDPYSYFGHLQDEMLRAVRLVVDTGLHAKHWTRQQVVDFFHAHSTTDEVEVQSETDRYIGDPGQALGYKIGQLKIVELRERAKTALGAKFDIRAFHDLVLDAGALPLDVLSKRVDAWIATQR